MQNREEYLRKKREYYQNNKHKWVEYAKEHREEINAKNRERRKRNVEIYRKKEQEWRKNNIEKNKEYQRRYRAKDGYQEKKKKYYIEHKDEYFRRAKENRDRHKEEYRCHSIVNNGLRRGELKKMACEVCGDADTQAHHNDYNKPLDVTWLCKKCHSAWHEHNEPIRFNGIKKCVLCGNDFRFSHRSQKFCSDGCRRAWNKNKAHEYYVANKGALRTHG